MNLRGFYKFSLVDYPGKIACIVFTGGCNFRCPYCHNAALVLDPLSQPPITEKEVLNFLAKRQGLLEGIVISGGEPTLQPGLKEFCQQIKALDFKIKLDTNSSNPEVVKELYHNGLIDALGLDVKAPSTQYAEAVNAADPKIADKVFEVIKFALAQKIPADIRTTVHKSLLSEADLQTMYSELRTLGVTEWTLQQYNPVEVIQPELSGIPTYSDAELVKVAEKLGAEVRVHGTTGRVLR